MRCQPHLRADRWPRFDSAQMDLLDQKMLLVPSLFLRGRRISWLLAAQPETVFENGANKQWPWWNILIQQKTHICIEDPIYELE